MYISAFLILIRTAHMYSLAILIKYFLKEYFLNEWYCLFCNTLLAALLYNDIWCYINYLKNKNNIPVQLFHYLFNMKLDTISIIISSITDVQLWTHSLKCEYMYVYNGRTVIPGINNEIIEQGYCLYVWDNLYFNMWFMICDHYIATNKVLLNKNYNSIYKCCY